MIPIPLVFLSLPPSLISYPHIYYIIIIIILTNARGLKIKKTAYGPRSIRTLNNINIDATSVIMPRHNHGIKGRLHLQKSIFKSFFPPVSVIIVIIIIVTASDIIYGESCVRNHKTILYTYTEFNLTDDALII
jgi:hypothetical protein